MRPTDSRDRRLGWRVVGASLAGAGWVGVGLLVCLATSVRFGGTYVPSVAFAEGYRAGSASEWPRAAPAEWPLPRYHRWTITGRVRYEEFGNVAPPPSDALVRPVGQPHVMVRVVSGFPMLAFEHWMFISPGASGGVRVFSTEGAFSATLPVVGMVRVGMLPVWPGAVVNTLCYAAAAWGLWWIPVALRRFARRRGRKCVKCGYDLVGLAVGVECPECGRGV